MRICKGANFQLFEGIKKQQEPRSFCNLCGKSFSRIDHLNRHIKARHEGIGHKCEICGKLFEMNGSLKHHIKTVHEGIREHECKICGKAFGKKAALRIHDENVHLGKAI